VRVVYRSLRERRCGVVWIDAPADVNTPRSSVSGCGQRLALASSADGGEPRLAAVR
jgi:arginase family enzyme